MAPCAPATAEFLSRQFQGLDADTVVRLFAGDFAGLEEEVSPELLLFARVIHELARDLLETARSELENLTPEQVAEGMGRIYGFLLYTAAGLLLSAGAATALKGQRIVALAKQLRRLPGLKSPAAQKAIDKLMDALRLLEPPKRGRADPPTPTAPPLAARPVEEATEIADDLFVDVAPKGMGETVLFGQRRVHPKFSVDPRYSNTSGRSLADVAADLRSGHLTPDDLPISAFRHPETGELVSMNTRTRAVLAEAGLEPSKVDIIDLNSLSKRQRKKYLSRLTEPLVIDSPLPGYRVPVTPSLSDHGIMTRPDGSVYIIEIPR